MVHRVHWADRDLAFEVGRDETVLAAALRQDVALPHDCQFGGCGTCRAQLLEGSVDYEELPLGLTEDEAALGQALLCQARPRSDLVLRSPVVDVPQARRLAARVEAVEPLGADVLHLRLRLSDGEEVSFLPGQYMNVLLPGGGRRSFSMASRPDGGRVDFHVRRIPGGAFTDRALPALRPGESLDVEIPLGGFRYHAEDYRPIVMVATGTGLAPIKSMLEALMDDPDCPPVSLYWGARTPPDLYLHERIAGWGERLYDFNYVPVLSRADGGWAGRRGYVQDAVLDDIGDLSEHAIYLCGSPAMIDAARATFATAGASPAHVYADSFVFQSR